MNGLQSIGDSPFVLFLLTVVFAFIIGLELNKKKEKGEVDEVFYGTERTLTFIGILAFILFEAQASFPPGYLIGLVSLAVLMAIFYAFSIYRHDHFGMTKVVVALLVYLFPLLLSTQPIWLSLLILVLLITLIEMKEQLKAFSQRIYSEEFLTLAKFIVITGVILPLAPNEPLYKGTSVSPYQLWLAVVAISAISYLSYLMQKYLFPNASLILSGLLGGLYSSTATTFILSKQSRNHPAKGAQYATAILLSTVMMFCRVYVLMFIFNSPLARSVFPYFGPLILGSGLLAWIIYRFGGKKEGTEQTPPVINPPKQNPLEFQVALIFALLYVGFSLLTEYTIREYGSEGLPVLSTIVGLADIDPFLMNLFQNKSGELTMGIISLSTMQTLTTNNFLKMAYAIVLSDPAARKFLLPGFLLINAACVAIIILL